MSALERNRVLGGTRRVAIPDPIKLTFTAKELCALHLAADLVVRTLNVGEHPELTRATEIVRLALESKGCVLDHEGWRTA